MTAHTKRAIYVTTDLMFSSRAAQAARGLGVDLQVVGSQKALAEALGTGTATLVIIDIDCVKAALPEFVATVRQQPVQTTIIAYGPHVDEAALASAESAGCDSVISRGQFNRELKSLLAEHLQAG